MRKLLALWTASLLLAVLSCAGCLGGAPQEETKLDIPRGGLEQAGEIVLAEFGSDKQKRIRNKASLHQAAGILESVVLKKKERQDGPPGTLFLAACDPLDFRMSIQVGGLYYKETYYDLPPRLLEQLRSVYEEASEAEEPAHWWT